MSYIDHNAFPLFHTSTYKAMATELASNLHAMTGSYAAVEDDVFCPSRMKSAQLPAIDSCQSSIFRELRSREDMQARADAKVAKQARAGLFGLTHRIGGLFAQPEVQMH
jgi:hypothetical protein